MPQTRQYVCALYFIFYCYIELRELMGYLLLIVAIHLSLFGSNLRGSQRQAGKAGPPFQGFPEVQKDATGPCTLGVSDTEDLPKWSVVGTDWLS